MSLTIHTDKKGNIHIDGTIVDNKEIENWLNQNLQNVSIKISDSLGQKTKNIKLSLTIKEK